MVKKVITLSEFEYDDLVSKREELMGEVRQKYYDEVRRPAIAGAVVMLFLCAWGYGAILEGYSTFPKLTLVTSAVVLIFYGLAVGASYSVLKKRIK